MTNIICISGKARHGKDITASFFRDHLLSDNRKVLIIHQADLLKHLCRQLFQWDGQKDEHGRHLLQYVGTDVIRAQNPDFWVNHIIDVLHFFPDHWDYVIIPDCRFPNEIDNLKNAGFQTLHIRVERKNAESDLTEEQKNHASETALANYPADCLLYNNGTTDDLSNAVRGLIDYLPFFQQWLPTPQTPRTESATID